MDSKNSLITLFLFFNLFFLSLVNSCSDCNNPPGPPPNRNPNPNPNPNPSLSPSKGSCHKDALKLGVCAKLLNGAVGANIGNPPDTPCCSILGELLDLEASICLCTTLKANILEININFPISLSLLVNICGKNLSSDFACA
ncbi:hypothetical protein RND71_018552 [Anisodus tanguticus]|uniref:Bifunctional inhibitor/plant lipid transfer protein/seed storage helical domain-containing protein n=1 Tax=Anisodus tanguticus TaxID=243964 RepID=A0AAE1VH07_9SOLA|nr:hypothetical protein RND71_018552 [Anisodus tanguticus]